MSQSASASTSYEIRVVGAGRESFFRDAYHAFLRLSWPRALAALVAFYLAVNTVFAALFAAVGGIAGARDGSYFDAFSFSAQTLGTIGYGAMYPRSLAAQLVVVMESVCGMLVTALSTGLLFAKFSQPVGRVAFATRATIAVMDGVPTLMLRLGNQRRNHIVEAQVRVVLTHTVKTLEGVTFYRMEDLALRRDRSPAMTRSWTVMHPLDGASPLRGATPESLAAEEAELMVSLVGTDETTSQPVHARRVYEHTRIAWGARHADVLSETPDGDIVLDVRRFDELVATAPSEGFPYRWQG